MQPLLPPPWLWSAAMPALRRRTRPPQRRELRQLQPAARRPRRCARRTIVGYGSMTRDGDNACSRNVSARTSASWRSCIAATAAPTVGSADERRSQLLASAARRSGRAGEARQTIRGRRARSAAVMRPRVDEHERHPLARAQALPGFPDAVVQHVDIDRIVGNSSATIVGRAPSEPALAELRTPRPDAGMRRDSPCSHPPHPSSRARIQRSSDARLIQRGRAGGTADDAAA